MNPFVAQSACRDRIKQAKTAGPRARQALMGVGGVTAAGAGVAALYQDSPVRRALDEAGHRQYRRGREKGRR